MYIRLCVCRYTDLEIYTYIYIHRYILEQNTHIYRCICVYLCMYTPTYQTCTAHEFVNVCEGAMIVIELVVKVCQCVVTVCGFVVNVCNIMVTVGNLY